jgi:hypothetical protein
MTKRVESILNSRGAPIVSLAEAFPGLTIICLQLVRLEYLDRTAVGR